MCVCVCVCVCLCVCARVCGVATRSEVRAVRVLGGGGRRRNAPTNGQVNQQNEGQEGASFRGRCYRVVCFELNTCPRLGRLPARQLHRGDYRVEVFGLGQAHLRQRSVVVRGTLHVAHPGHVIGDGLSTPQHTHTHTFGSGFGSSVHAAAATAQPPTGCLLQCAVCARPSLAGALPAAVRAGNRAVGLWVPATPRTAPRQMPRAVNDLPCSGPPPTRSAS